MKTTYIVALVVGIVVVCAAAYFVLSDSDDQDDEEVSQNFDGRLMVYGNANNDDLITEKDIKALEEIISTGWDRSKNPYADANQDGEINQADIDTVKKMINREPMLLYYKNCADHVAKVDYPIGNIVVIGSDPMRAMQILDLKDKVVGRNHSGNPDLYLDPTLNATIVQNAEVVSMSSMKIDIGLLTNLMNKTPVDVIVTGKTTLEKDEPQLNKLGVEVMHMAFNNDQVGLNDFLTMGYLANKEERSHEVVSFYDNLYSDMEAKLAKVNDSNRVQAISMAGGGGLYANDLTTGYGSWILQAGAESPATRAILQGEDSKTVVKGDTWHLIKEFDVPYVVYSQGYNYNYDGKYFADNYWEGYIERFSWDKMTPTNYPNSIVLMNWNLYPPVGIAYLCGLFYPDIFGADYGDIAHQEFVDSFYSDLSSKNYKVTDYCFCVTYDDVKAYL